MINFFRKIRQRFLSENKFTKYLLYAIGETLLVVVGILIALQVNNRNEEWKEKKLEKVYLIDVHKEFESNKVQFNATISQYIKQFELADSLAKKVFPITDANWPQINSVFSDAFLPYSFDPRNSSIDVLINSGKIDLIKSDSLKKLLLSWNDQFEDYKEEEYALQKWGDAYNDIYLNEPALISSSGIFAYRNSNANLSNELKIKLEKLLMKRRSSLGVIISKWNFNQESKELLASIDAIISLTEKYVN